MLTPAWWDMRHHPLQSAAWRSRSRFVALACGRGSGKTEMARRRIVRFLCVKRPHHEPPAYVYALPTQNQARRVAWDKLKSLVPKEWLDGEPRESDMVIKTKFGSALYLVGMDKPQRIEGNQYDGVVMDESCDQKPGAFDRTVRPTLTHRRGWCWRIGVPKRQGPGAADFRKAFMDWSWTPDGVPGPLGKDYSAYTWPSGDILSEEEIRDAARSLDQKDFDEQFGAIWQGTSGLVFYAFDEHLNVEPAAGHNYDPNRPIIVGSDFNVSPMAWVVGQQFTTGTLNIVDEVWKRNTNTPATLDELDRRYNHPNPHQAGWMFFGDATSKARKTSAVASDYAHIQNDKRFLNKKVFYPNANPSVHERFSACNAAFCNALGQRRVFVHPRCKNLIHDLTSRAYVPGSRDVDDHDDVGHITDALGYVIHRVWPVVPTTDLVPSVLVGAA